MTKKTAQQDVWVLRRKKFRVHDNLVGHVFTSQVEAQQWLDQKIVKGEYKAVPFRAHWVPARQGRWKIGKASKGETLE